MGSARWLLASVAVAYIGTTYAQPSPQVQARISAAIKAAQESKSMNIDYTAFVNPFIGTGELLFVRQRRVFLTALSQITPTMGMSGKSSPPGRVMTRQIIPALQPGRVSSLRNGTSQYEQRRLAHLLLSRLQVKFTTDLTGYAPAGKIPRSLADARF
jgi:hypothetical protein